MGTLLVATGPTGFPQVPLLFSMRVRGTLRITPTNPVIDLSHSARGAVGTLVVRSNDRAEARTEIPLFAFGYSDL